MAWRFLAMHAAATLVALLVLGSAGESPWREWRGSPGWSNESAAADASWLRSAPVAPVAADSRTVRRPGPPAALPLAEPSAIPTARVVATRASLVRAAWHVDAALSARGYDAIAPPAS